MTQFYLIRHASNDLVSKAIAGWLPEVHLNAEGRRQAEQLAQRLAATDIHRIYSSPLERAQETASPLSRQVGREVHIAEEIGEVRFGAWTGQELASLESDPHWQQWNHCRSNCRPPGGETLLEVQCRFVGFVQRLDEEFSGETIALVSHGDPIRAVLLYYLGMSLDLIHRLEISPASVSILSIGDCSIQVLGLNQVDPLLKDAKG